MGQVVFLARFLAGAALAEFLLVRVALRLGPVLPSHDAATAVLVWAGRLGTWALNVSTVGGLALLALLVVALLREKGRAATGPLLAAAALALGVALARFLGPQATDLARQPAFLIALSAASLPPLVLVAASGMIARQGRLPLVVLVVAYGAAFYHYIGLAGGPHWGGSLSLALAEALVLLAAPALLWTLRPRWNSGVAAVATVVGALYLALALMGPWVASALAIWDFGFTSFLPAYIYALALWVAVYAVLALATWGRRGTLASLGLALMALGGLRLDYAYFSILAMAGLLLTATALTAEQPPLAKRGQEKGAHPLPVAVATAAGAGYTTET